MTMSHMIDLEAIRDELKAALEATGRLNALGENFPALARNSARALASLKMLELNISDLYELGIVVPGVKETSGR